MKKIIAIAIILSFIPILSVNIAKGNMASQDEIYGIAVDSHGDVIVTGQYSLGENYVIRTQKYDGKTGKLIWQRDYNQPNIKLNVGKAVIVDSQDNIYVGGIVGVGNIFSNSGFPKTDYIIIKYDRNGNLLWHKTYNKHFGDFLVDLGIDENRNVYATGITIKFELTSETLSNINFWTIKVDGTTGSKIKEDEYDKEKIDAAFGIDVRDNSIVVVGSIEENNVSKYAIIKYDKNLQLQWQKFYGKNATASDTAILSNGNIVVTGNKDEDFWTLKLNSNGNEIWNKINKKSKKDDALGIAVDGDDNIIVGGYVTKSDNIEKWHMIKYGGNGNVIWDKDFDVVGEIKRIATYGKYIFAGGYKVIGGMNEYCVIKYDENGNKIWEGTEQGITELKADFAYYPQNPTRTDYVYFSDKSTGASQWEWDFGDGGTSNEKNPVHQYKNIGTYTVTLTVRGTINGIEQTDSISKQITVVNAPPIASFSYEPLNPIVGEQITFDASSSDDKDGYITNYTWNFGDGSNAYGKHVIHVFNKEGNYNVKLTVIDNDGASKSTLKVVTVNKAGENKPPIAEFDFYPFSPKIGDKVKFNASKSYDEDGYIVLYRWDWNGDGKYDEELTQPLATHKWNEGGEYTVTLQVEDNNSLTNTYSKVINVKNESSSGLLLSGESKISLNKGKEKTIKLTVKNGLPFELSGINIVIENATKGINVAIIDKNITLGSGEKKEIKLKIKADNEGNLRLRAVGNGISSDELSIQIKITNKTPSFTFIAFMVALAFILIFRKWKK